MTNNNLEEYFDKQTIKEMPEGLFSHVVVYEWICQFTDEDIGSSVEIAIDDKINRVRMIQFSGAYCILYRLLLYNRAYHQNTSITSENALLGCQCSVNYLS